ncbi:glycerophosphodiester phosphodiesterase [Microbacterium sp. LWH12-1.2]|uniref:glycerophosphodiester phosphodiesterase n=1 Tax=Microbacterium sp. LWH12-1.2 TaxID=3135259 RepID=UPI003435BFA2
MARLALPVGRSLASGYRLTRRSFGRTLVLVALVQGAVAIVAAPLLAGMFSIAARASGLTAVTTTSAAQFLRSPLGVGIAVASLVLVVLTLLTQAAVFAVVADERRHGRLAVVGAIAHRIGARTLLLLRRPSTLLLVPYLVLIIPLGHAGIGSVLTQWVAIPAFVTDEVMKTPLHAVLYTLVLAVVWWVNLRLIFTIPLLVLEPISVPAAIARSWQITRWRSIRVVVLLAGVLVPMTAALGVLALVTPLATYASDAWAPSASVAVGAISLGVGQVVAFFIVGLFLMVQTQVLVTAAASAGALASVVPHEEPLSISSRDDPVAEAAPTDATPSRAARARAIIAGAGAVVASAVLAAGAVPPLAEIADGATTVLAHRGFTERGVENTLGSLDAAHAAGAELVEMDIQQTSDGGWVLMHDPDLNRLAGLDTSIAQLTVAEATGVTVRDDIGHAEPIPTLEQYLQRADDLGQQLLIEIKVHGGESEGFVAELIEIIDRVDGADEHIYHTLSADVVEEFTALRPDLTIGFIVPLAYGGVPQTPASFLVVEQSVYTRALRDAVWAEGKSLYVWTVQDAAQMRALYRDNVDGIITDHPDIALRQLDEVASESALSARLVDAVDRLFISP